MAESVPIPASIWQRIQAFLRSGATGSIVLDVHGGRVRTVSINERIDANKVEPRSAAHVELQ